MNKLLQWIYKNRANYYGKKLLPLIRNNEKILDIGSGSGYVAEILSRKANVTLVDIVDYNQTMLSLKLYDGKHLPYKDNSFDAGIIIAVLHHTPNPEKFLAECKRVCKRIIIIEEVYKTVFEKSLVELWEWFWNKTSKITTYYNFHSDEEWKNIFKNLHLKLVKNDDFKSSLFTLNMKLYVIQK